MGNFSPSNCRTTFCNSLGTLILLSHGVEECGQSWFGDNPRKSFIVVSTDFVVCSMNKECVIKIEDQQNNGKTNLFNPMVVLSIKQGVCSFTRLFRIYVTRLPSSLLTLLL